MLRLHEDTGSGKVERAKAKSNGQNCEEHLTNIKNIILWGKHYVIFLLCPFIGGNVIFILLSA